MKLSLSLLLFSSIPAIVSAQMSATAATIASYWNITKTPTYTASGNTFSWTYDGIASGFPINLGTDVKVAFYTPACYVKDSSSPSEAGYDTTFFSGRTMSRSLSSPFHPVLVFTMHPKLLKGESEVYTPAAGGANEELKFCVRLGLWTTDDPQEVNFMETIATITLQMDGSFTTDDISVGPKDKDTTTASREYKVSAALCNAPPGGQGKFRQGEIIQVCIVPEGVGLSDGVVLTGLADFTWTRSGVSPQKACCDPAAQPSTAFNALSDVDIKSDKITVSSVLYATFFATEGDVQANGNVAMGYSRRRLGGNDEKRKLEDAGVAPAGFDVKVPVTAETDGPVALTQEAAGSNSFPGLACAILGLVSAFLLA